MKIFNIVLTGGPCAGKTSSILAIKKHLKMQNIPCLVVPETATELIPNIIDKEIPNLYDFQELIMKRQLIKEEDTISYARKNFANSEKCVIIYDRGIFDNMAYLNNKAEFKKMLSSFFLNETETLDQYDMVLDLLSLATCKPDKYNLSNEARTETIDEAILLDKKTSNAWANHHNLKLISSNISLDEELNLIIKLIDNLINNNDIIIRKKYLVDIENSNLERYKEMNKLYICEHHFDIGSENNYKCMVSANDIIKGSYILHIYKEIDNNKIILENQVIDSDDLKTLIRKFKFIGGDTKKEINFVENRMLYKLDIYNDKITLEVQSNECDKEIIIPNDLKVYNDNLIDINKNDQSITHIKKLIRFK